MSSGAIHCNKVIQQLELDTGLPRADWIDHASRREHWRSIGDHACFKNEQRYWHSYGMSRRQRWTSPDRVQRRVDILISEVQASTLLPATYPYHLQPYDHPIHINAFHVRHSPLHQIPRTHPSRIRPTPRRILQRWDWTPAVPPPSASATTIRPRRGSLRALDGSDPPPPV